MIAHRGTLHAGLLTLAILAGGASAAGEGAGDSISQRPDPDGRATRVSIAFYVIDVAEVDDAKRTFNADVFVHCQWHDPRLANPQVARRLVPLTAVWHPTLLILNQRSVNRVLPEVVEVDRQGTVGYRQRFQGTFSVPLNLRSFPLDEQVLSVRMVSPGNSPGDLELVAAERSGRAPSFSILDWHIDPPTPQADPLVTPDGREVAGFSCSMAARRLATAYVYQFIIPLTFIVCMSWAACWMAPEQLAPRQGIAVTSMLTIIAYRFVLANQLPRVAYLTRFDYLLLGCTTLVFLVLVEVVGSHRFMIHGHTERARRLDRWARAVFPALYVMLLTAVSLW